MIWVLPSYSFCDTFLTFPVSGWCSSLGAWTCLAYDTATVITRHQDSQSQPDFIFPDVSKTFRLKYRCGARSVVGDYGIWTEACLFEYSHHCQARASCGVNGRQGPGSHAVKVGTGKSREKGDLQPRKNKARSVAHLICSNRTLGKHRVLLDS